MAQLPYPGDHEYKKDICRIRFAKDRTSTHTRRRMVSSYPVHGVAPSTSPFVASLLQCRYVSTVVTML